MRCSPTLRVRGKNRRARLASVVVTLLTLAACSSGCRVLRCKTTEENITAARSLSLQGMDAQQKDRWDQAELLYASAVTKCPTDERARCGYAESLWRRGAQQEAVAHMEQAVRLSGDDPERQVQLGCMYLSRGELNKALAASKKAIAANQQLPAAWALRGDVLRAEGDRNDALASYHRALSYREHYPEVQLAVAEIYSQQNRPDRALATLQSLGDHYPPGQTPSDVHYRQGLVLRDLGRFYHAAQCLARATAGGQSSPDMLYELGRTHLLAGDVTSARLACSSALTGHPQHAPSLALRAELDGQQIRMAAAIEPRQF